MIYALPSRSILLLNDVHLSSAFKKAEQGKNDALVADTLKALDCCDSKNIVIVITSNLDPKGPAFDPWTFRTGRVDVCI